MEAVLDSFSGSGQKQRLRALDSTIIENGMPPMLREDEAIQLLVLKG
jgi:hypothetical protein